MNDDLAVWLRVRERTRWSEVPWVAGPVRGERDGLADFIDTTVAQRDPDRARRLRHALRLARASAADPRPLSFGVLASWQRHVLDVPRVAFRSGTAFAKDGRERYGRDPDTPAIFDRCLAQSAEPDLPLPARAARAYLDVAFFHPFPDGNSRAALLALYFVLAREYVTLDQPVPLAVRRADDPTGALALARLINVLITATGMGRRCDRAARTNEQAARIATAGTPDTMC